MKKRFLAIALIMVIAASLMGGCADKKPAANPGNSDNINPTGEEIILRILENDTAKEKGYLEVLLNAFNEKYKEYNVVAVDANMDEYSNLAENGPYGYGPDVLYQANDKIMTYADDKHVLPLTASDFETSGKVPDQAYEAFSIVKDGKKYTCGVPVNAQEPMLFYREDMLPADWETSWDKDKNGIADFFENWNDLYAYSKSLRDNDKSANKNEKYGFMTSWNDLYLNGEFLFSYGAYVFGKNSEGVLDPSDIGIGKGDAVKGLSAIRQFSALMNEGCIDDTIKFTRYEQVANGTFFCTVSTPDTYTMFVDKLAVKYEAEGMAKEDAKNKALSNLKMVELPAKFPADGNLLTESEKVTSWIDTKVMGGVNGYAVSAYTKHKAAAIAFVDFATSYEMITKRSEMLGIVPTRSDVVEAEGNMTAKTVLKALENNRIYLMPSIKAVDQIWTASHTMLSDVAKDAFREKNGEVLKYNTNDKLQEALDKAAKNIYDAIFTLK